MNQSLPAFKLSPLDPKFVGAKPIENAPDEIFLDLEAKKRLIIQRKRNGNAAYIPATGKNKRRVELYSRGINPLTAHFPTLVEELRAMNLPSDTLLGGETLVQVDGIDSPSAFGSLARSKPERAVGLQRDGVSVELALFSVIVHRGKSVVHLPYKDRLDILQNLMAKHTSDRVNLVEIIPGSFKAAKKRSVTSKWEGLVLYDADAPSEYRLDGKIDQVPRPSGCWKWKEYAEGDFVATGWVPSTAPSHAGMVKDLLLHQYSPITGELQHWGKCGIGLSKKDRENIAAEFTNDPNCRMVFELKFERRTPNRRLIAARIIRRRFDKKPEECIAPAEFG